MVSVSQQSWQRLDMKNIHHGIFFFRSREMGVPRVESTTIGDKRRRPLEQRGRRGDNTKLHTHSQHLMIYPYPTPCELFLKGSSTTKGMFIPIGESREEGTDRNLSTSLAESK